MTWNGSETDSGMARNTTDSLGMNFNPILSSGIFHSMNVNNYILYHNSDPHSHKISFHFYCQKCERELIYSSVEKGIKNQKKQCPNCNEENILSLSNENFFLSVNFEYEIRFMLEHKKQFRDSIIKKLQSTNEADNNNLIRDIHDAHLYKETNRLFPNTICYIIRTDGAPLHHCSKRGFWPLQVIIIDLPNNIRHKLVFLVGIIILDREPKPDLTS